MSKRFVLYLVVCLCFLPYRLAAASFDGSRLMLCAVIEVFECSAVGTCERGTAESINIPQFVRIHVTEKFLSGTGDNARTTPIQRVDHLNGRLLLQGGENGRGWSILIDEESGKLSASIADDQAGFVIFGACTVD